MKKFLLSLVSLFVLAIGNIWADEVYYTLDATSADVQTDNNSYANIGTATVGEIEWKFQGNGKINPWRLGGKNLTDEDRVVYTSTAMDVAITSVKLEVGNASNITVNSLKLIVASDAEFNTVIDEVSKDFEANSVISFEPTSPATDWAENSYYKFVFNVSVSGGSNRFVEFMKVEFLKAEGGDNPPVTVAKPTITPSASFIGSTTVTITAEDGTDIYYTVDGTTPTTESTKYTDAFAITETTTVKAIAVKGGVTSSEATATFTLIPGYSSISAVTALTSNDVFVFTGEALIVAKPTANHVYIQDETGSALLYDSTGEKTAAAEVGKTMAANWSGKVSIYKKLFELVPDQAIAVKDGDAATVTYPEATAEDITLENVNKVVLLKGITSYSVDGKNLTITIGENEIAGYNQFGLEIAAAEDGKTYEMVGSISRYNDNAQFQPMSIKEAEEPAPAKLFADGKYYLQNAASMKFWGAANSWGTQASLLEHPEYITLVGNEDGTYKMETQVSQGGNKYYFGGEWMDTNTPVSLNITIAREVGENAVTGKPMYLYNIQNAADNLYFYDPGVEGQSLIKTTDFEGSYNAMWVIASEEEVLASLKDATADDPVDATFLIADPRFGRNNRNVSAWTNEGGSVLTGGNSDKHSAEKYHGVFNVYQNLANAPAGVYKFTAQGFYRQDGTDNEHLPVFYANEETSTFPVRTGTENSMADGCASFETGKYQAEPIFVKVTEAGALTVGAKLEGNTALWCMWDNFALEYYGADADINALKFADYIAQVNELVGEATEMKENPRITPGTQSLLIQAIENTEDLQTVDDYKTAINALNAAISQAENDIKNKTAIEGMYTLIESTNVVTEEALTTYKSMADTYNSDWEEGTLTETVVNPYAIAGWRSANTYDDFLLSAWTIGDKQCKDFDTSLYINTWSIEGENDGTEFKVPFFEYFTDASNALGANTLTATIQDLAPGKYVVKAWVRNQPKNGVEAADISGITMTVNEGTAVDVTEGEVQGGFNIGEFAAVGTVDVDGILKVSFNVAEDNNSHWLSFQNVKYEKFNEPTNLDFELTEAITDGICTYAKDMSKNATVHFGAQPVDGWKALNATDNIYEGADRGALDQKAGGVFAYGSDAWLGGTDFKAPATAPENSTSTKALGLISVWGGDNAIIQYTQPISMEAGNYEITVLLQNTKGGNALTQNLIGFIAEDGTSYLAETTKYPEGQWYEEKIMFTLDKLTNGVLSLGFQNGSGSGAAPHIFIDNVSIKFVSAEEIAAAKLAEAKAKANATLDTLVPFGDGLFMYNEAEVNAAREAVANATTVEEVEAIVMPKANAPKEGAKYSFKQKASGLYLSTYVTVDNGGEVTASGVCLAEEPVYFTFEEGEGGYYLANGEEYVGFAGTNNWTMAATADKKMLISPAAVSVDDVFYYTLNEAKGMIATDGTAAGAACYTDKSVAGSGDKAYWTIAEETSETYAVNVTYGNHGIAVADKAEAAEGETVTITVTPDAGYKVDEASFSWGDGQELEFSIISENQGQFTMPAGIVNISFTFKRNYGSYYIAGNMTDWAVTDAYKMSSNKEVTEEAEEYTFTMDLTTASQFKVVKVDGETQTWIPDGMGNAFGENGEIKADGKYIIRFRPNADGGDDWFEKMITIESAEDPVIANYEFVASEWIAGDPGRISADNVVVNDKANTITVDKAGNNNVALLYKGKDYIVSADNRYFVIKATGLSTEEGKSYLWWLNNKNNGSQIAPNTIYDEDGVTVFAWDLMQVAIAGTLGTEETLFTNGSDWSTTFGMTLADEAVPAVISYIGFQTSIPQPVEEYEYAFDATLWVAGDPGRISADNVVVDVVANTITVDKSGNNNIALVYRTDKMYYVEGADYFVIQGTGLSTEEGKSYLWWLNGANNGTQVAPTFTKVDENGLVTFAWDIAASGIGASFNAAKTYLVGGEGWNTTFGLTLADEAVPAVISYIGFDKSDSDIMTGINGIYAAFGNDGAIYDLAGRRVKNVVKGNLYIVNGKKVLVK